MSDETTQNQIAWLIKQIKCIKNNNCNDCPPGSGETDLTADNVGTGIGVFQEKLNNILEMKTFLPDGKITITENGDHITIGVNLDDISLMDLVEFAGENLANEAGNIMVVNQTGDGIDFTELPVDTGGDDWGVQVVISDNSLSGNGADAPLSVTSPFPGFSNLNSDYGVTLSLVAGSGSYTDLVDLPVLEQYGGSISGIINLQTQTFTLNSMNLVINDWGNQVAETDNTINGDGTSGNELTVANPFPGFTSLVNDYGITLNSIATSGAWTDILGLPVLTQDGGNVSGSINLDNGTFTLDAIGAGGDNWGSQVAVTNNTLSGSGAPGDPLGLANIVITGSSGSEITGNINLLTGEFTLSAVESGADNWGEQVAETNNSLTGDGTFNNPLGLSITTIVSDGVGNITGNINLLTGYFHLDFDGVIGGGGDNWGSQVVVTDETTLTGAGTVSNPLSVIAAGIGDNWGNQVAQVNAPITGDGTNANPLGLTFTTLTDNGGNVVGTINLLTGQFTLDTGGGTGDDWGSQAAETTSPVQGDGTSGDPISLEFPQINNSAGSEITGIVNLATGEFTLSNSISDLQTLQEVFDYTQSQDGDITAVSGASNENLIKIDNDFIVLRDKGNGTFSKLRLYSSGTFEYTQLTSSVLYLGNLGPETNCTNVNIKAQNSVNIDAVSSGISLDSFGTTSIDAFNIDLNSSSFTDIISGNGSTTGLIKIKAQQIEIKDPTQTMHSVFYQESWYISRNMLSGDVIGFNLDSAGLKIRTVGQSAGSATVGQVLKLINVDGTVEFADESGGGAGDNWGSQVVVHDGTMTGDGANTPLSVVFTDLATDYGITLSTIATTGSYSDLINLPVLTQDAGNITGIIDLTAGTFSLLAGSVAVTANQGLEESSGNITLGGSITSDRIITNDSTGFGNGALIINRNSTEKIEQSTAGIQMASANGATTWRSATSYDLNDGGNQKELIIGVTDTKSHIRSIENMVLQSDETVLLTGFQGCTIQSTGSVAATSCTVDPNYFSALYGVSGSSPLSFRLDDNGLSLATLNVVNDIATVGQVLKLVNTSGLVEFADESGGGGGGATLLTMAVEVSANSTGIIGSELPVNSTAGLISITEPSNPSADDEFVVFDSRATSSTNNIVVNFTTENLHGSTGSDVLNINGSYAKYRYVNGTIGWRREK